METVNESEIERQFEIFEQTFLTSEEKEQAREIIFHISRALNDRSIRGEITFQEFQNLLLSNVESIFFLSMIKYFNYWEDKIQEGKTLDDLTYEELYTLYVETEKNSDDAELLRGKEKFWSSFTLMYLLFNLVYGGKMLDLMRREIDSRKPTTIISQKV